MATCAFASPGCLRRPLPLKNSKYGPKRSRLAPCALTPIQSELAAQLERGAGLYSTGDEGAEMAAAVSTLIASNCCLRPGPASIAEGQGTWEVFHAPHIARLSAALGARFQPIRYTLRGKQLVSNVRYQHRLLGTGWLSASGTLAAADDATLELSFDRFWVDLGEDRLRPELPPLQGISSRGASHSGSSTAVDDSKSSSGGSMQDDSNSGSDGSSGGGGLQGLLDGVVGAIGRVAFLPSFARFPVEYLDGGEAGLAVFRFPPLSSSIAVVRVDPKSHSQSSSKDSSSISSSKDAATAASPAVAGEPLA